MLEFIECLDSPQLAAVRRRELDIPRDKASTLGRSAVEAAAAGSYSCRGRRIAWDHLVQQACRAKVSIPAEADLPVAASNRFPATRVQVSNETTLGAARRLAETGLRPAALNFANGISPGGGFLDGARAQEEVLCRSSALYNTLAGDPMYASHKERSRPDSTDWVIYSPDVPVFRRRRVGTGAALAFELPDLRRAARQIHRSAGGGRSPPAPDPAGAGNRPSIRPRCTGPWSLGLRRLRQRSPHMVSGLIRAGGLGYTGDLSPEATPYSRPIKVPGPGQPFLAGFGLKQTLWAQTDSPNTVGRAPYSAEWKTRRLPACRPHSYSATDSMGGHSITPVGSRQNKPHAEHDKAAISD